MKPLSSHWADLAAARIVRDKGDKSCYVLASGITPSGQVHVGNFREVITVDLVASALKKLGKKVRFIYSWDNFDTFRKIPPNLPQGIDFSLYLRQPIARIPDPWQQEDSYASGRIKVFEKELQQLAINPEFLYQEDKYARGEYGQELIVALENKDKIRAILNENRTQPLALDWLPTTIYCAQCQRDEMTTQRYEGNKQYFYHCAHCDHQETIDITTCRNIKLNWRIDWPMRWHHEKVDFEPGGKDHSSRGGSFDTGAKIVTQIWHRSPPNYLQYDFVMIKGGAGKMSSSSGNLYTLSQVMAVYEPEIVRWIFANHRPNHDFALSFDEEVFKIYEEFDRSERLAFSDQPSKKANQWLLNQRSYELATLARRLPLTLPVRASFRELCNRLQICNKDINRTDERFYAQIITSNDDKKRFRQRAECALFWLREYALDEYRFSLRTQTLSVQDQSTNKVLLALRKVVEDNNLEDLTTTQLNEKIWQQCINDTNIDAKEAFKIIYQQLIARDQGPRLPGFLKEIGNKKLLNLLPLDS